MKTGSVFLRATSSELGGWTWVFLESRHLFRLKFGKRFNQHLVDFSRRYQNPSTVGFFSVRRSKSVHVNHSVVLFLLVRDDVWSQFGDGLIGWSVAAKELHYGMMTDIVYLEHLRGAKWMVRGAAINHPLGSYWHLLGGAGRWWFYFFWFSPLLGEMIQFDEHIFQNGLVQPPTRKWRQILYPAGNGSSISHQKGSGGFFHRLKSGAWEGIC